MPVSPSVGAVEDGACAVHEVGNQLSLPRAPCRGAGGQRVGFREGVQQVQRLGVTDRVGDLADGGRIGQIPADGDVGQQQVVLHHPHKGVDVGRPDAEPRRDAPHQVHPGSRVIAG